MRRSIPARSALLLVLFTLSACSALPEDIRASLPEAMRGDTQALTDYPTPQFSGQWKDRDFPELSIQLKQSGNDFSFSRTGSHRGIMNDSVYQGTATGRSLKMTYSAQYAGQIRRTRGACSGVAAKDSGSLQLTCEDAIKGTYPLNLVKQ